MEVNITQALKSGGLTLDSDTATRSAQIAIDNMNHIALGLVLVLVAISIVWLVKNY